MVSAVNMKVDTEELQEFFTRFNRVSLAVKRSKLPKYKQDIVIRLIELKLALYYGIAKPHVKQSSVNALKRTLLEGELEYA